MESDRIKATSGGLKTYLREAGREQYGGEPRHGTGSRGVAAAQQGHQEVKELAAANIVARDKRYHSEHKLGTLFKKKKNKFFFFND